MNESTLISSLVAESAVALLVALDDAVAAEAELLRLGLLQLREALIIMKLLPHLTVL